ncbi:MAG: N-acetylmuramoyl-L-alanine amidase [Oligosphaeraceae bacterium]
MILLRLPLLLLAGLLVLPCLLCQGAQGAAQKPSASPKPIREMTVNKRSYVILKDVAARYGFRFFAQKTGKTQICTLLTPQKEAIVFTVKEPFFTLSGTLCSLSFPVEYQKGLFLLEKTDYTEFLEPILQTSLLPKRKIQHIVVDAGHGGKDQGAASGKVLEKNLNLAMARKVAAILRKRGYTVSMTRTEDETLTLDARCAFAREKKADLFLSIHCNALEDKAINGIEVYVANPPGVPSVGTKTLGKEGAATPFQRTSALWAYFTQRALLKASGGAKDRGVRRKQFKVIIDSPAPAMLVELGFLTNDEERARLLKPDYQDKLAVALCDAIDKLKKTLQ